LASPWRLCANRQPSGDQYVYKYSGGFATYPQQQLPIACYSKEANKTFFCYGGTAKGKRSEEHTSELQSLS